MEATDVLIIAGSVEAGRVLDSALAGRGLVSYVAVGDIDGLRELSLVGARLVVLALPIADSGACEMVGRVRRIDDAAEIVVVGRDGDVASPADARALGVRAVAADPLVEPAVFADVVRAALESRREKSAVRALAGAEVAPPGTGWSSVVGESPAIGRVLRLLQQVCRRTTSGCAPTILLYGETGTGKGFIARCVHYNGPRRGNPLVEVNCAALPATLMESELFGHERGSFTDAKASRGGLFEAADGGTLFLDEIGSVPLDVQAKLLTAIEEKRVRRIGGRSTVTIDVHIIAATHDDLKRKVEAGEFREDLYHRLNVVTLTMPPLRERGADVLLLASSFLTSLCDEYGMPPRRLSDDARAWLLDYRWPGNVRELRNQMERIVLLENDEVVRAEHFLSLQRDEVEDDDSQVTVAPGDQAGFKVTLPPRGVPLALLEREVIRAALARCAGNVSRAARHLSISRQTMIYRMKKHGLASPSSPGLYSFSDDPES